jgi:DNA-directed RNA polymerase subunit RPC12/RpoP
MKPTIARCPTCGSRFFIEEPNQLLCVPCQNAQDQPKRDQNYIAELQQGRVAVGCITTRTMQRGGVVTDSEVSRETN